MKNVRELTDYQLRMKDNRAKAIDTLDLILRTGHPVGLKIKTNLHIPAHPFPADLQVPVPQPELPPNTVTTEYHDGIVADAQQAIAQWKRHNTALEERIEKLQSAVNLTPDFSEEHAKEIQRLVLKNNKLLTESKTWRAEIIKLENKVGKQHLELQDIDIQNKQLWADLKTATTPAKKDTPIADVLGTEIVPKKRTIEELAKAGYVIKPEAPKIPYSNSDGGPLEQLGDKLAAAKDVVDPHAHLSLDELPFLEGIRDPGERPFGCALRKHEVWQIRRYIESGRKNTWIEKKMGISSASCSQIKTGNSYSKVPKEKKRRAVKVHAGEGVITQRKKP